MRITLLTILAAFSMPFAPGVAIADDWVATKLRGSVLVLVDNDWVKLRRGEVVPDDRVIRTLRHGRVTFERGREVIELGSDTQIQIVDRTGRKFTTVTQHFGSVEVEADVRQVQHFAVQTPHLSAVVKGTKFTVVSGKDKAKVSVQRGRVAVEDRDTAQSTVLSLGQSATTASGGAPLEVAGRGKLPVVHGPDGKPVVKSNGSSYGALSPNQAAKAARDAALAAGASKQEAAKIAKEAREAAKEARKAAKESKSESAKQSGGADNSGSFGGTGISGGDSYSGGGDTSSVSDSDKSKDKDKD